MIRQSVARALKKVACWHVGESATPEMLDQIKCEFVMTMYVGHRIDWTGYVDQINVIFRENGCPDVKIPPELLH